MLTIRRPRGRPRTRQIAPDQGTLELQRQREAKKKLLPHSLQATLQDINAYLAGSHLHACYLMGWISQDIFFSTLAYARLMHRAFRSMGLRCTIKSYLLPHHHRSGSSPREDRRAENLWHEISCQLKEIYQPQHHQILARLLTMTAAPWPQRDEINYVLHRLHEVMQGRKKKSLAIDH